MYELITQAANQLFLAAGTHALSPSEASRTSLIKEREAVRMMFQSAVANREALQLDERNVVDLAELVAGVEKQVGAALGVAA